MMYLRSVTLALLLLGVAGGRLATSTAAGRAQSWLRQHQSPDDAGLSDLKASDPGSYELVQALLMKQQAGLLDPANPTGRKQEEHESAADIMRSAPTIAGADMPISEVTYSAPVHHASFTHGNPWAFKAKTGDDDEAMVANVMGAVSELKGASPSSSLLSSQRSTEAAPSSALNADMDLISGSGGSAPSAHGSNFYGISMGWGNKAAPAAPVASMSQQQAYVSQPVPAATNRANPYLTGIDLGNNQEAPAPQPMASMIKQNSYLSTINFNNVHRQAPQAPLGKAANDLTGFSWSEYSDVASGKSQPHVETQYIQQMDAKVQDTKITGVLSDWLAPKEDAPVHKRVKRQEEQPAEKTDPFAMDEYNNWARQ